MRAEGITPVRVTTGSMAPTVQPGDWVIAYKLRTVHRGDIVELNYPVGTTGRAIKRVAAVEGDEVVVTPQSVKVNGREASAGIAPVPVRVTTLVVPPRQVFLLGDNAAGSIDSRSFGPLSEEELVAAVATVPQPRPLAAAVAALLALGSLSYLVEKIRRRRRSRTA